MKIYSFQEPSNVTFLSLNKKVTKELSQRVAFYKDAPLWKPPPAVKMSCFTTSRHKCPDLCPPVTESHRTAERRSEHLRVILL